MREKTKPEKIKWTSGNYPKDSGDYYITINCSLSKRPYVKCLYFCNDSSYGGWGKCGDCHTPDISEIIAYSKIIVPKHYIRPKPKNFKEKVARDMAGLKEDEKLDYIISLIIASESKKDLK